MSIFFSTFTSFCSIYSCFAAVAPDHVAAVMRCGFITDSCVQDKAFGGGQKTEACSDRYPAMDRTVGRCGCCCRWCRRAVHLADMNDCSQRLGFHAAAIFAQARAAGTGRPFDIHLTSKCLLSRSLLSSLLVSPLSVTRPFILRHDFWPERFCCSTYLLFFSLPPNTYP